MGPSGSSPSSTAAPAAGEPYSLEEVRRHADAMATQVEGTLVPFMRSLSLEARRITLGAVLRNVESIIALDGIAAYSVNDFPPQLRAIAERDLVLQRPPQGNGEVA